ncbi:MAG: ribonuclease HI family protein [Nitrososphaerota archaeon]|nr:ribonuclease HI family protein [Nitrososphaerota archaeon]
MVYFDGLCEPRNPGGVATYGIIIQKDGETIYEDSGLAEAEPWSNDTSNNVAEYSAVIKALEWLDLNRKHNTSVIVRGDSKLIVSQLNGEFKVKSLRIIELHHKAKKLLAKFRSIKIEWVDRSLNEEADRLSRIAYKRYVSAHPKPT